MYAIVLDRNKQYFVKEGDFINVDFLNLSIDSIYNVTDIILFNDGENYIFDSIELKDKIVKFKVVKHFKSDKKIALKFRRRKHHMKRICSRQKNTTLQVIFIGNN